MVVEKKINEVVNRLNRTKEERFPDLRLEREQRDQEERDDKRKELQAKVSDVSFADVLYVPCVPPSPLHDCTVVPC